MAVARRINLSGFPCIDPALIGLDDDTANSVSIPIGTAPGRAYLAVNRADGDSLSLNDPQTIAFIDNGTTTVLSGYYIDRRAVVNVDGDGKAAYLIELFDKRALLSLSGINKRFNCLKPLPYHLSDSTQLLEKYFSDSLSGGTALHTWAEVWSAIWAELPGIAGAEPSLPYTPAGTPKNFEWRGSTWDTAVSEFLAAICCTIKFDPITDTFSVVRLSQAQVGLAAALTAANAAATRPLLFHSRDPSTLTVTDSPASWFLLAPKQHVQNDDHTEPALDGTTSSGVSGAASGTKEAVWINTPATYCETGGIQNNAEIVARAADLASELSGKASNSNGDGHIEYGGCVAELLALGTGSQVSEIVVSDYGNTGPDAEGMRTKLYQYTLDLQHGTPQNINTEKLIRVRLDEPLAPGQSAAATVVVYDFDTDDWLADQCTLTVYDSLNMAVGGLPEGFELFAKWHYDSERFEIFSVPEGIVFFQAYQAKELTTTPFLATILVFDGTAWIDSGIIINVYDDYRHEPNTPGFFTGCTTIDRGWAKLRAVSDSPATPDDYELIWMSGPAHIVRFALGGTRSPSGAAESVPATIAAYYLYGHNGLQAISVWFPDGEFPRAQSGAVGRAIYDDRNRRYEVVECDQMGLYAVALLTADMCGSTCAFDDFTIATFFPFSQTPADVPTSGVNICDHCGKSGDIVVLLWLEYLEEWNVIDVTKHDIEVITATQTVTVPGDGSTTEDTCYTQAYFQPVCIEMCQDGEWRNIDHCCCDPTPASQTPISDTECCPGDPVGTTLYMHFSNKTGSGADYPDTVPIYYVGNPTIDIWQTIEEICPDCTNSGQGTLTCQGDGSWTLSSTNLCGPCVPDSATCDPFSLDFGTLDVAGTQGGVAGTVDLIINDVP